MTEFPDDLKQAFRAYGESHPDPEPTANFTPMLWEKIEARRSSLVVMRRFTQALVSMAMAAALVLGVFVIPQMQDRRDLTKSYAEVIAENEQEVAVAFTMPVASEDPLR